MSMSKKFDFGVNARSFTSVMTQLKISGQWLFIMLIYLLFNRSLECPCDSDEQRWSKSGQSPESPCPIVQKLTYVLSSPFLLDIHFKLMNRWWISLNCSVLLDSFATKNESHDWQSVSILKLICLAVIIFSIFSISFSNQSNQIYYKHIVNIVWYCLLCNDVVLHQYIQLKL